MTGTRPWWKGPSVSTDRIDTTPPDGPRAFSGSDAVGFDAEAWAPPGPRTDEAVQTSYPATSPTCSPS